MKLSNLFSKREVGSGLKLIEELPYREYRPESKMFILSDTSLGVIYRLDLLEHEPMSVENIGELRSQLEQWLNLPSNCVAQFLLQQTEMTEAEIDARLKLDYEPECQVAGFLRAERVKKFKEQARDHGGIYVRRCYFSIRYIADSGALNLAELIPQSLTDSVIGGLNQFERRQAEFEKILSRLESLSKIHIDRIDACELREVLQKSFHCDTSDSASINPEVPLNEQLFFSSIEADEKGLLGNRVTKTVSLLVPSDHYEGGPTVFLNLDFPFLLSLRMTFPSKAKVAKILGIKEYCTKSSYSAKSQRQFEELQETKRRLAEGDPCVHMCWSLTVSGQGEREATERANKVIALAIEAFDCNAILEDEIGFDLLRSSMPLHFNPKSEWGTQRHVPVHRSELINFLPIFDSFRGTELPLQIFKSRDGNLVPLSATEGQTCQHAVFLGDSGSGKSALINNFINGFKALNPEPIIFVIDFNTSQIMNVKYYGGELNVFNHEEGCPASVFRGVYDQKKVSVITNWICEAVRLTSPTFVLESEHKEAISQAVRFAYRKKALAAGIRFVEGDLFDIESSEPIAVDLDSIAAELSYLPGQEGFERFRAPIEDLLVKLRNFYGDGLYAHYFKAPEKTLKYDKRFYVYDLMKIQDDPVLLNLTIASLFEEIRQVKLLPENHAREIWTILDEIAVLGRESQLLTQYFIQKAETSRKDAFWIIGATNRPQNFVEIPVCLALAQVAEHFVFLPMDLDNVRLLAKHSEKITAADQENIASLRMRRDQHSEAYIWSKSQGRRGVIRYEQTPHEKWQSPTNAKAAREALKALKQSGGNAVEAIRSLIQNFPEGVN
ncbi:MAG: TraC family protein [Bdellovibrionales bacterium]